MTLETWVLFFLAYLLVTLSPGPNVLLVVTHAMKYGFRSIFTVIGANLLCQLMIVVAVATGIGALVTVDSLAFKVVKYVGAAYLVFLGAKLIVKTWREGVGALHVQKDRVTHLPQLRRRFAEGFLVSAGNPKTVVFLAAFLPQFIDPSAALTLQFAEMYLTIAAIVAAIHAIYAGVAVFVRARVVNHRIRKGTSYATGGLFVALGIGLSTST